MYTSITKVKITDVYKTNHSYEALIKVAEWLIKKDKLRSEDCPIELTKREGKRYLINTQKKHKNGDDFKQPKSLSNGLFIETKYSTINCKEYARRLLKRYSPGDILEVEIERFGSIAVKSKVFK